MKSVVKDWPIRFENVDMDVRVEFYLLYLFMPPVQQQKCSAVDKTKKEVMEPLSLSRY